LLLYRNEPKSWVAEIPAIEGFRRIFSRFEKLDVLLLGFLSFALIVGALRVV
jgi:hypothetical protein